MNYFEMFTGIAGFSKGIEKAYAEIDGQPNSDESGPDASVNVCLGNRTSARNGAENTACSNWGGAKMPECIGFSEIGKVANGILKYRYPDVTNYGDAAAIVCSDLPDFDFLCAGFPCQTFSIAGKRQGFNEARGTLFFEIARILSHKRPEHFLLENVEGLRSHEEGKTLQEILRILAELDYRVEVVLLNSKHYGVPQNRERIFFIGHFGSGCSREILSFGEDAQFAFEDSGHAYCLDAANSLAVEEKQRIRRLTPTECSRLQSFPDDWADFGMFQNKHGEWHVREISDTGKYQVFGNAVTVSVVKAIIARMIEKGCLA